MNNTNNNIEIILRNKIQSLANFLISICNNENKKNMIQDTMIGLPLYKILLFISLLDKNKFNHQIDNFVKLYEINDNDYNREIIIEYLNYFINVKEILNE